MLHIKVVSTIINNVAALKLLFSNLKLHKQQTETTSQLVCWDLKRSILHVGFSKPLEWKIQNKHTIKETFLYCVIDVLHL